MHYRTYANCLLVVMHSQTFIPHCSDQSLMSRNFTRHKSLASYQPTFMNIPTSFEMGGVSDDPNT